MRRVNAYLFIYFLVMGLQNNNLFKDEGWTSKKARAEMQ